MRGPTYDYKDFAVLFVDDEEKAVKYFSKICGDEFNIHTAQSAEEGYEVFQKHRDEIALVVTDQRMPGEQGTDLLERIYKEKPETIRILSTAYADVDAAIDAINLGSIYRYITKPWDIPELEVTLKRAMEFYIVQKERDELMKQKISSFHKLMIADRIVMLGILLLSRKSELKNVPAAISSFAQLGAEPFPQSDLTSAYKSDGDYWKNLYERQKEFLLDCSAKLKHSLMEGQPTTGETAEFTAVVNGLKNEFANEVDNRIDFSKTGGESFTLSGSEKQYVSVLEKFFRSLLAIAQPGHTFSVETSLSTSPKCAELKVTGSYDDLSKVVYMLFDPGMNGELEIETSVELLSACLGIYHLGGSIHRGKGENGALHFTIQLGGSDLVPETDEHESFDLFQEMIVNESFWGRVLEQDM